MATNDTGCRMPKTKPTEVTRNGRDRRIDDRVCGADAETPSGLEQPLDGVDIRQDSGYCRGQSASLVVDIDCNYGIVRRFRDILYFLPPLHRGWCLGEQHPGRLGLGYHEFRFLDRYRPCRNIDFGHSPSVPPEVAYVDKPSCG